MARRPAQRADQEKHHAPPHRRGAHRTGTSYQPAARRLTTRIQWKKLSAGDWAAYAAYAADVGCRNAPGQVRIMITP